MAKIKAIYVRVSSDSQEYASQEPDLKQWASGKEGVKWFMDKESGTTMNRPKMNKLLELVRMGKVSDIVVWRLDRLGRTAAGLITLFDELKELGVNLISLRDGVTLDTPAGRMMANVLASVAQYETEIRKERQRAGIKAAKAEGKTWGGSEKGARKAKTIKQKDAVLALKEKGYPITQIASSLSLSRRTVYSIINENQGNLVAQ